MYVSPCSHFGDSARTVPQPWWPLSPGIFLLNEHLFNLPLAFLSHWLLPRKLVFLDFWVATVFATGYLLPGVHIKTVGRMRNDGYTIHIVNASPELIFIADY